MTYKVIKDFGNAKKGDIFKEVVDEDVFMNPYHVYVMERIEGEDNISDNSEHYMKSWISMELSKEMIDAYVNAGFLLAEDNEKKKCEVTDKDKITDISIYIDTLIDTYTNDYNNLLKDFEDGNVQPCVKVEAETVYHNLIKVLNSIKAKINE